MLKANEQAQSEIDVVLNCSENYGLFLFNYATSSVTM
jgi:hypothetical protein